MSGGGPAGAAGAVFSPGAATRLGLAAGGRGAPLCAEADWLNANAKANAKIEQAIAAIVRIMSPPLKARGRGINSFGRFLRRRPYPVAKRDKSAPVRDSGAT